MATIERTSPEVEETSRNLSLPVATLTVLGSVIAVLGLFAAGDIAVVIVGLVSVAVAGILQVLSSR